VPGRARLRHIDCQAVPLSAFRGCDRPGSGVKRVPSSRPKALLHTISACTPEGPNDNGKQPKVLDGSRALNVASTRTSLPVLADVSRIRAVSNNFALILRDVQ
jgi:hypothetical protein